MPILTEQEIGSLFRQMQCGKQGRCPGTHVCGMGHPKGYVPDVEYHARLRSSTAKKSETKYTKDNEELNPAMKNKTWVEAEAEEDLIREKMEVEEENRRRRIKLKQSREEFDEVIEIPTVAVVKHSIVDDGSNSQKETNMDNSYMEELEIVDLENKHENKKVNRETMSNTIKSEQKSYSKESILLSMERPEKKKSPNIDFVLERIIDEAPAVNCATEAHVTDDKIPEAKQTSRSNKDAKETETKRRENKVYTSKLSNTQTHEEFHRTGLANLGNTCYMNSILQTLMCTEMLIKELSSFPTKAALELREMSREIFSLTMVMKSGEYRLISPRKFKKELTTANPIFGSRQQQDAHEALSCILDSMINEIERVGEKKIIENIFDGRMNMKRQCINCGAMSTKSDPFRYLQVEIPQKKSTITECIAKFMREQIIQDKICEKCGCSGAKESTSIAELPNILIVQLKRFRQEGKWQHKVYTRVQPDHHLDMKQYIKPEPGITVMGGTSYQLYSIVDHYGGLSSGHYTAMCKDFDDNWICYDDAVSQRKTNEDVISDKLAYMLFYKKVDSMTTLNSAHSTEEGDGCKRTTEKVPQQCNKDNVKWQSCPDESTPTEETEENDEHTNCSADR